jgi:hypothetical protein
MAEAAIPDRDTFMKKVAADFRSLGRRVMEVAKKAASATIQVAKKAGNWFTNNKVVSWTWNKAKLAATKVGSGVSQAVRWTIDKPWAWAAGVITGYVLTPQVVPYLLGLGLAGSLYGTYRLIRWIRRSSDEELTVREAYQEAALEADERRLEMIQEEIDETEAKAKVLKDRIAKRKAAEEAAAAVEQVVEEAVEQAVAEAQDITEKIAAKSNGYKVKLPEGNLDPNETLAQRYNTLSELIDAETAKAEADRDVEYFNELQARRNLIHVRAGKHSLAKDASVGEIHRDFRLTLVTQWALDNPDVTSVEFGEVSGIFPNALYRGAMAEHVRLNKVVALKAKHDELKGKGKAA